jgi:hypothetical protein
VGIPGGEGVVNPLVNAITYETPKKCLVTRELKTHETYGFEYLDFSPVQTEEEIDLSFLVHTTGMAYYAPSSERGDGLHIYYLYWKDKVLPKLIHMLKRKGYTNVNIYHFDPWGFTHQPLSVPNQTDRDFGLFNHIGDITQMGEPQVGEPQVGEHLQFELDGINVNQSFIKQEYPTNDLLEDYSTHGQTLPSRLNYPQSFCIFNWGNVPEIRDYLVPSIYHGFPCDNYQVNEELRSSGGNLSFKLYNDKTVSTLQEHKLTATDVRKVIEPFFLVGDSAQRGCILCHNPLINRFYTYQDEKIVTDISVRGVILKDRRPEAYLTWPEGYYNEFTLDSAVGGGVYFFVDFLKNKIIHKALNHLIENDWMKILNDLLVASEHRVTDDCKKYLSDLVKEVQTKEQTDQHLAKEQNFILKLIKKDKTLLMFFLPQMNTEWVQKYLYHLIDNEIELMWYK